jgi:hypothetical protein
MVIHHMVDGTIRHSIDGLIIPKSFVTVYELANKRRGIQNGNSNTSGTIKKK